MDTYRGQGGRRLQEQTEALAVEADTSEPLRCLPLTPTWRQLSVGDPGKGRASAVAFLQVDKRTT